jgi:hypothetical protein
MAFKCPHCGRHGISFPEKLFTSASVWNHRTATCRFCRKAARLSGLVVQLQFLLFIFALAIIAWTVPGEYRVTAALIIAGIIVSIGVLGPLKKQLI